MKIEKGQYGYINAYKKGKLLVTLALAAMISFVLITMLIMYGDTGRVMVIFAILLTLPFAKFLIAYIICAKFSSMDEEDYKKIIKSFENRPQISEDNKDIYEGLLFDMTVSEYEGMHFFDSMCVKNGNVIALVLNKKYKENKKAYENCLAECSAHSKYKFVIHIYDDVDTYTKKICSIPEPNHNNKLIDAHMREQILSYGV